MWQNSVVLLDYALRELQVAILHNTKKVEIVLENYFTGDVNSMRKLSDNLEIKTITEILREEFTNYEIRSIVGQKGQLNSIITFSHAPCVLSYPLVWELILQKKANP